MPELPECETVRAQLEYQLGNRQFESRILSDWRKLPKGLLLLQGHTIAGVHRHGKYLFIEAGPLMLMSHLGMSGYWEVRKHAKVGRKHAHLALRGRDGWVTYFDPRKFGNMEVLQSRLVPELHHKTAREGLYYYTLGPDAVGPYYRDAKLGAAALKRGFMEVSANCEIKNALLDQSVIAGLGNIYAAEVLFRCRISPFRKVRDLTQAEITSLAERIPRLLKTAIANGGTTFKGANPFRSLEDTGRYTKLLEVYGREGERCVRCIHKTKIKRIKQAGRSTFWCPRCQR